MTSLLFVVVFVLGSAAAAFSPRYRNWLLGARTVVKAVGPVAYNWLR